MKPGDHRQITKRAILEYRNFYKTGFSKMIYEYRDYIIDGSEYEDRLFHGMGLKRLFNWHFYSRDETTYLKPFPLYGLVDVYPSSGKIFEDHLKTFRKLIKTGNNKKKMMETLGRILHHIQDMSTPAHVAPVYHGLGFYPKWKAFPGKYDLLEEYSKANIELHLLKIKHIKKPGGKDKKIITLYKNAAEDTRRFLKTYCLIRNVNGRKTKLTSRIFWRKFNIKSGEGVAAGFVEYGPYADVFWKNPRKHKEGINVNNEFPKQFTLLLKIYEYCLQKMVEDTLRCLKIAEVMWNKSFGAGPQIIQKGFMH